MTARQRPAKGKPPGEAPRVKAQDFPALTQFLGGYLHQDFLLEHPTAPAAANAFRTDASSEEAEAVDVELDRLLSLTERWTVTQLRRFLKTLGSSWLPSSRADLEALRSPR